MSLTLNLAIIEQSEQRSRFAWQLTNQGAQALSQWQLEFLFRHYIEPDSLDHGEINQVGSLCTLTPASQFQVLASGQVASGEFSVDTRPLVMMDDGIREARVISESNQRLSVDIAPLELLTVQQDIHPLPQASQQSVPMPLIPLPQEYTLGVGQFCFASKTTQRVGSLAQLASEWLREELAKLGSELVESSNAQVEYRYCEGLCGGAYQLEITPQRLMLSAGTHVGFCHATASVLQLLDDNLALPVCTISDAPAYSYRGLMLDCARHFHPLSTIKQLIEQMARLKLNTLHWHLTDDEGWRLEIDAYPELTRIGAWRGPGERLEAQYTHIDKRYGGFYSKREVRELIEFAKLRGITVVPEIDIPGHCRAAILSLPELLNDPDDKSEYRSVQHYTDNVLSPGLAGTYRFIETVLDEVCALFPAPYVHIGGDEVPAGVWQASPSCQALMREQDYSSNAELQGHLMRFAEQCLERHNKRMLGWQEITLGDKVSKQAVVFSWQDEQAGLQAIDAGFDVVMTPAQYTYLDLAQDTGAEQPGADWAGKLPLETVYGYQPPRFDTKHAQVLGIQAALWSELVDSEQRLQQMLYPRLFAIAEVAWCDPTRRDWQGFIDRLAIDPIDPAPGQCLA